MGRQANNCFAWGNQVCLRERKESGAREKEDTEERSGVGVGERERNLILRDLFIEQIFIHLLIMLDAGVE